jgi:hypothetical protein
MRLVGTVLLLVGILLCISVTWAAIGFFAMAFGLICLLIHENKIARSRIPTRSTISSQEEVPLQPQQTVGIASPAPHPPAIPMKPPATPLFPNLASHDLTSDDLASHDFAFHDLSSSDPASTPSPSFFDQEKWQALCAQDRELAKLVAVLRPFGTKYVDELARAFLFFNDKDYLPLILKKIVASARRDAGIDDRSGSKSLISAADPILDNRTIKSAAKNDPVLRIVKPTKSIEPQKHSMLVEREGFVFAPLTPAPTTSESPAAYQSQRYDGRSRILAAGSNDIKIDRPETSAGKHLAAAPSDNQERNLTELLSRLKATGQTNQVQATVALARHDATLRVVSDFETIRVAPNNEPPPLQATKSPRRADIDAAAPQIPSTEMSGRDGMPIFRVQKEDASATEREGADNLSLLLLKLG